MKEITFKNIYKHGYIVLGNDHLLHIHFPELLLMYDGNFIEFKRIPTVEDFKATAAYLRNFHLKIDQQHIKFYLPENEKPTSELIDYLKQEEYDFGFLELYAIEPSQFQKVEGDPNIEVLEVTSELLDSYLTLQYNQELLYGESFAKQKVNVHKDHFQDERFMQIMALYEGVPAGSVDVIISDETAEIDGLFVKEDFRNKGIARKLQQFVMDHFKDKTVILVADGEDTPREMYRKQGYEPLGYQYEILKVFTN